MLEKIDFARQEPEPPRSGPLKTPESEAIEAKIRKFKRNGGKVQKIRQGLGAGQTSVEKCKNNGRYRYK